MSSEQAVENAVSSLEMEGFEISEELKKLCLKKINNEITMAEYIKSAMELKGVKI